MRKQKDLSLNSNKEFNTTQLHVEKSLDRHIFHRDIFAHYLRWTYVVNITRPGEIVIDFGCGSAELLEVMYRNRHTPKKYIGLDIRKQTIKKNEATWGKRVDFAKFICADLTKKVEVKPAGTLVVSFEVMEHVNKKNGEAFLRNFANAGIKGATYLLSTPNFDPSVGAAQNHIYDGKVQEWDHEELEKLLNKFFRIEKKFGTFASVRDYQPHLSRDQQSVFNRLREYFDPNLMSVIFAPMFPDKSRNTLWVMTRR